MTSLEKKLKEFEKTERFKTLVAENMKINSNFASESKGHSAKEAAIKFGERMKRILRNEISGIKSLVTGENFLDHIIVEEKFIKGTGWIVDVSFDDAFMHRESLDPDDYPDGAELDVLFNEGYSARAYTYGIWHGEAIYSRKQRDALHFIQQSVEKFNTEQKGKAIAQYSSKYNGGTL